MTVHDAVKASMAKWPGIIEDGGRILVPTHCLYPSHGVVTVIVEGAPPASAFTTAVRRLMSLNPRAVLYSMPWQYCDPRRADAPTRRACLR
jgi:hypothetical protein